MQYLVFDANVTQRWRRVKEFVDSCQKTPEKKPKGSKAGDTRAKGPSRNELMLKAKAKGIKKFRIINKEELIEILKEGILKSVSTRSCLGQ